MFRWVLVSLITGKIVAGFNDFEMLRNACKALSLEQKLEYYCYDTTHLDNLPDNGYVEV